MDLPDPGIKLVSLKSPALAGGFFTTSAIEEVYSAYTYINIIPVNSHSIPDNNTSDIIIYIQQMRKQILTRGQEILLRIHA